MRALSSIIRLVDSQFPTNSKCFYFWCGVKPQLVVKFTSDLTFGNLITSVLLFLEIKFLGCFRYPNSTSHIQYGKYVRHNLSTYSCALICEKEIGRRTPFSLSKKTLCHCDRHLEDSKITKRVSDEYCAYRCTNALTRTEYCGHFDTMTVYAGTCSWSSYNEFQST